MKKILVLTTLIASLVFVGNVSAFGGRSVSSQRIVTRNVNSGHVQQVRVQQVRQVQHVQQVRVQQVQVQPVIQYQYVQPVQQLQQLNQYCPQ